MNNIKYNREVLQTNPTLYKKQVRMISLGNQIIYYLQQLYLKSKVKIYSLTNIISQKKIEKIMQKKWLYGILFFAVLGDSSIVNAALDGQVNGKNFVKGAGVVATQSGTAFGNNGTANAWCYYTGCPRASSGIYITGRDAHGISDNMNFESGMYGIVVGKGVVILLEGTLTFYSQWSDPNTKGVTVTFSSTAKPVSSTGIEYFNGYSRYYSASNGTSGDMPYGFQNIQGDLKISLWIGPEAGGTYKLPQLTVNINTDAVPISEINGGGEFSVIDPLECAVAAPPTVNFGLVNINGVAKDGLLAVKQQGIDISCTANSPDSTSEQMRITFQGEHEGNYWGRLDMLDSDKNRMAYIRGRYLDGSGLCAGDSDNEVGFNGKSGTKTINDIKVGNISVPITWSLCSNGSNRLGDGTAQATVIIDWD